MNQLHEDILREYHPEMLKNSLMLDKLDELIKVYPLDSFDLNPHLQLHQIADQIIKYMLDEKQFVVTREEVLTMWLAANIFGIRNDKGTSSFKLIKP